MPEFYSDKIKELAITLSTTILKVGSWDLSILHELDYEDEYSSSTIYCYKKIKIDKTKVEKCIFQIEYFNDSGVEQDSYLIWDQYRLYLSESDVLSLTEQKLSQICRAHDQDLVRLTNVNQLVSCPALPVEIRQWLVMNGVASLTEDLSKTRSNLKKLIKTSLKETITKNLLKGN